MDKAWKRTERTLAEILGGRRIPITGRTRGETPDIDHDRYSVEVKLRKKLPNWIWDAIDQAEKAKTKNKLPVVILHELNKRHLNDLVVMRLEDFLKLDRRSKK